MLQTIFQNDATLLFLVIWTLPWKGVALWKAARLQDKRWFIAILIINTFAILDIIYIFYVSKRMALHRAFDGVT